MNLNINLEYLKEKKELVSVALYSVAALLVVLTAVNVTGYYVLSTRAENDVLNAIKQSIRSQDEVAKILNDTALMANALTNNNVFTLTRSTEVAMDAASITNPVQEIRGILGKSALIGEQWYGEGDTVPGTSNTYARIIAIKPMSVTVEFNGITTDFFPLEASALESTMSSNYGYNNLNLNSVANILSNFMGGGMMGGGRGGRGGGGGMMGGGMMGGGGGRGGGGGGRGGGMGGMGGGMGGGGGRGGGGGGGRGGGGRG